MQREQMVELAELVATAVVNVLEKKGIVSNTPVNSKDKPKTAYQKTEQLLYNYPNFKKIVVESKLEVEELRKYGVPQKSSGAMGERVQTSRTVQGIVLPEESVENAVHNVEARVQGTVRAIVLIDKCMAALATDPYYKILEMRYFEGRTQEDIALTFNCSQVTISNNKSRLVRELAMRLFPNQAIEEMMM